MLNQEASRTALATAYLRAAHQVLDARPLIFEDPMALKLLGADTEKQINETIERYKIPGALSLRSHVVLRARYTEDRLAAAVTRGVGQYIIVGAGLDTFSLRQPDWAKALHIVEIDHPVTQQLKLKRIEDAGLSVPDNVTFAEIDFENESLSEGLQRYEIAAGIPTFFSWLGVTMYLTETAIEATLRCMGGYPAGSEAVVTYLQKPADDEPEEMEKFNALAARVAQVGEPFVSHFTQDVFAAMLRKTGFSSVEFLTVEDAAKYFQQGNSDLPQSRRTGIVSALC